MVGNGSRIDDCVKDTVLCAGRLSQGCSTSYFSEAADIRKQEIEDDCRAKCLSFKLLKALSQQGLNTHNVFATFSKQSRLR